jgi:uroporphyrinogen-III synthase
VNGTVLILRPQPGADATAARARALGLRPVVVPLFVVEPLLWEAPDRGGFDAVMFTSANAVRHGGEGLEAFLGLPCYAVGGATATAARQAGFLDVRIGPDDMAGLVAMMAAERVRAAFHPCGRDRIALAQPPVRITSVPVYASEAVDRLAETARAVLHQAAVLIHSPRAGALFGRFVEDDRQEVSIVAISDAAAAAAGEGWKQVAVAAWPRDEALLELAAKLCQTGPR